MAIMSLFDDIEIKEKKKAKSIEELLAEIEEGRAVDIEVTKLLKSSKLSKTEKISLIHERILKVLGKQKKNVQIITTKAELHAFIDGAFEAGRIDIDTETNNSIDPVTCKLMGPCLYYPGSKQVYIPINHRDPETFDLLSWQLTEEDVKEELLRIVQSRESWKPDWTDGTPVETQSYFEYWIEHCFKNGEKIKSPLVVMHNGKFDYEVIACTCGVKLPVDYDTMLASRLINENDQAGLKYLYTTYIDRTQAKYNLENLYANTCYADSDPYIFGLYAATDAKMTDDVFMFQLPYWLDPANARPLALFARVEMRCLLATAAQELIGIKVDRAYGQRLHVKYTKLVNELDKKINAELTSYIPLINNWRLSKEANKKTINYVPAKTTMSREKIEKSYPEVDKKGNRFKYGKTKNEQFGEEITSSVLTSPIKLAILLYDILECPVVDKEKPRGTGGDILDQISEKKDLPILKYIIERRGYMKLLSTYIDTIPILCAHWPDGRIRFHLNQLGTDTGRFSSGGKVGYMDNYGTLSEKRVEVSGINIQNIPSYATNIRALFIGETTYSDHESNNGIFEVPEYEEVETTNGYKYCKDLTTEDLIIADERPYTIKKKVYVDAKKAYLLEV